MVTTAPPSSYLSYQSQSSTNMPRKCSKKQFYHKQYAWKNKINEEEATTVYCSINDDWGWKIIIMFDPTLTLTQRCQFTLINSLTTTVAIYYNSLQTRLDYKTLTSCFTDCLNNWLAMAGLKSIEMYRNNKDIHNKKKRLCKYLILKIFL